MSRDSLYNLEMLIAKLLRFGVLLAGAFLLVGWMTQFQFFGNPLEKFQTYAHEPFAVGFQSSWQQHNVGMVIGYLGLCILISLPILRVLMTAILLGRQREFLMASAAVLVFVALILSFSLGIEI